MKLVWSERALVSLEAIVERAPRGGSAIYSEVDRLVRSPFPGMYRRVRGRINTHVLVVPPYVVIYRIDGDILSIREVRDGRRHSQDS